MTSLHRAERDRPRSAGPAALGHHVEFYDQEQCLVDAVVAFVRPALGDGVTVVVATAEHREAIAAALTAVGTELDDLECRGRLVMLDASATLAQIMVDDALQPSAFLEVIGGVIAQAVRRGDPVRVFGEMVALLWEQGNISRTIELEDLWNQLAAVHAFGLLCGYPSVLFTHPEAHADFQAVCHQHTAVTVPGELGGRLTGAAGGQDQAVRWSFPAELTSGALARAQLRELLAAWKLMELLDDVQLLSTEVINNAVVHARSEVRVAVRQRDEKVRVEVTDFGGGEPRRPETRLDDTHGRGLMLVDALSTHWGTAVEGRSKTVWFEVATAPTG